MPTACTACRKRTRCRSKLRNFRSDLSHIFSFCILLLVHHGSSTTSARRCLFLEGLFGTMTLSPGEDKDWSPSPDRWSPGPAHCNYSAEFGCCQSSFDSSWTDLNKTATLTNHIGRRWAKALTTNNGFWQARWNGMAKWRHRKIFYIHRETASCSHQEQASTKREKAKRKRNCLPAFTFMSWFSSLLRAWGFRNMAKCKDSIKIFLRARAFRRSKFTLWSSIFVEDSSSILPRILMLAFTVERWVFCIKTINLHLCAQIEGAHQDLNVPVVWKFMMC